jgi:hypothetical protein
MFVIFILKIFNMKIAVYTFISGRYDHLKPFNKDFNKEADFYLFTDIPQPKPVDSGEYKTVIVPIEKGYERYTSRHYKMSSHLLFPSYEYVIWVDGTTSLQVSPSELVNKYLQTCDLAAFKYPDDDCIYSHAAKCVAAGRFAAANVNPQMNFYRSEGFPEHAGLCECRVILRKNTESIKELNELWLKEYKKWLTCDQLTLNYCTWKLGIKYNMIPWFNPEFYFTLHDLYNPHIYIR